VVGDLLPVDKAGEPVIFNSQVGGPGGIFNKVP
jgi:hypothetical protein